MTAATDAASAPRPAAAVQLGLEPHPEGGWYLETWAAGHAVETPRGPRPTANLIYYYLDVGDQSAWHLVANDETWLWHGPGTVVLELGGSGERPATASTHRLGRDLAAGERPQLLIPAGTWQRALPQQGEGALVSCLVSPGFSYDDWRLAE